MHAETGQLKQELATLKAANIDVSNRMRRNNLLFIGIDDDPKETWQQSEEKVITFCSTQLTLPLLSSNIERAHRIGTFSADKKRPIIVKFNNYKAKDGILSCGIKLKGTNYAIREDFAAATRLARSKLLKYIRPAKCAFKLKLDKLLVGKRCFSYDSLSDSIIECTQELTAQQKTSELFANSSSSTD